jgi:hypothetical protein
MPDIFHHLFLPPCSHDNYSMRRICGLFVPKFHTNYGRRTILCACAELWNKLPLEIKEIKITKQFLLAVRDHLRANQL